MSSKTLLLYFLLFCTCFSFSQTKIVDSTTGHPVSYATISFNNGYGLFADDEGEFTFTQKKYPDIDTLYISALGYSDLKIPVRNVSKIITLETEIDALDEVLITSNTDRKYKTEQIKPYLDHNYFHCWLPTIESEIAVYFNNTNDVQKQIAAVHFPITLESQDWDKRTRSNTDKKPFSTLFKVKFYNNDNGYPGKEIVYRTIVFRATENDGQEFVLNVLDEGIFIPASGIFVSLQVLGYTDANGKLLNNKKFKEIKSRDGSIVRIPTNFRPLLPFTDKISENRTFVKRVFINDNKWIRFEKGNHLKSTLLQSGLNNYGIGLTNHVYKE